MAYEREAYCFRLRRGQDLLEEIKAFAAAHDIRAGYIGSCAGCVSRARLRDASGVNIKELEGPLEIAALTGTVSAARTHLHIALAGEDLAAVGGHLVTGCIVDTTAEIVICVLRDLEFEEEYDAETGYGELKILDRQGGLRRL